MNTKIAEKCAEINLMLVMTSAEDLPSIGIIMELYKDVKALAIEDKDRKLSDACEWIEKKQSDKDFFSILTEFSKNISLYIEDISINIIPGNTVEAKTEGGISGNNDTNGNVETSFLGEYIENHSLLLEDFESWILDYRANPTNPEDFTKQVKRYLHNLKGDSGTIGLTGIERVCHHIEDYLENKDAGTIINELIKFREWVLECMEAYADGSQIKLPSEQFIHILNIMPDANKPADENIDGAENDSSAANQEVEIEHPALEAKIYSISGENDILFEFAVEAEEHLQNVENIILEKDSEYTKDDIDCIFRAVHSIKGGSAYFTLEEMTGCSHILENYLSEVRDGKRQFDEKLKSLQLRYIDLQKNVLKRAREAALSDRVLEFESDSLVFLRDLENYGHGQESAKHVANKATETVKPAAQKTSAAVSEDSLQPKVQKENLPEHKNNEKVEVKNFVKVDTNRLDLLIDSIGEMVIYSSMLIKQCRELLGNNQNVMNASHRVEKFSRDLQDIGMSMRLVPIKGLFQKMSRLVWDTSRKLGKDIVFEMEGEDTELDRNLIDKLTDPLMHMVRNALDHGVEGKDERIEKGKSGQGKIKLSAYHAGGTINICIEDDGRGLDPEKLIKKAREKGIIEENERLSDAEAFHLIFAAGFSTAAAVTDISGRGVGMDVVRRNVESLRGRINIESALNQGSKFTIELPLTLAIVDGIQVRVSGESYIIPNFSIVEFVRVAEDSLTNTLDTAETFLFRGQYLPVFRLSKIFQLPENPQAGTELSFVIVENGTEHIALMVDEIKGDYSTVIKSLGQIFDDTRGLAGCAIMPDGEVSLIIDVRSLIELARSTYKKSEKRVQLDSGLSGGAAAEVIH